MKLPFGKKYKGWDIDDIPSDYLHWCLSNLKRLNPAMRQAIEMSLANRGNTPPDYDEPYDEPKPPTPLLIETLNRWYRLLAMAHHPDRGGDVEKMKRINEDYERLKKDQTNL